MSVVSMHRYFTIFVYIFILKTCSAFLHSRIFTSKSVISATTSTSSPVNSIFKLFEPIQFLTEKDLRAKYVSSMLLRFSFFLGQGVGLSLTGFDKTNEKSAKIDTLAVINALRDALTAESIDDLSKPLIGSFDGMSESEIQRDLFSRNFAAIAGLLKKELDYIDNGVYKYPYDLDPTDQFASKQWNPINVVSQLSNYITDRRSVLDRRDRKDALEVQRNFKTTKYPDYYLQNFHYQTDGWLSSKSAEIYDYQVESLFLGTADTMRRQILPAVAKFMEGKNPADMKFLDVATGTGRFASFLLDNYRDLELTALDLSPFYIEEAKKLLKRFDKVTYVEAPAEAMPFPNESFDAITCVYMFHELPMEVRKQVLGEMYRVLKPGGKLFFVDSAQSGEVPYERILTGFTITAHEPYYLDYTKMDIPSTFAEAGFKVDEVGVHWVTKTVSATKITTTSAPEVIIEQSVASEEDKILN